MVQRRMVGLRGLLLGAGACIGGHAAPLDPTGTLPKIEVDPATRMFVDSDGLYRIFHGVNAVTKLPPLVPSTGAFNIENSLGLEDADMLAGWGFNVVRLGVLWQGVMPEMDVNGDGIINATYLEEIKTVVDILAAKGIYTILDAHQDNLSGRTCGEGIPTWLFDRMLKLSGFNPKNSKLLRFPAPLPYHLPIQEDGSPSIVDCQKYQFFTESLSFEGNAAWKALYSLPQVHEQFRRSWGAVAQALGDVPGVIGYELLNEPAMSTYSGLNDALLLPLYRKGIEGIREFDNRSIVFYEPIVEEPFVDSVTRREPKFPVYGLEGVNHVNRQAYAYHNYCAPTSDTSGIDKVCRFLIKNVWESVQRDLDTWKVAGFMTEFGAVGDDKTGYETIDGQCDGADSHLQSWAYWTYKSNYDITTQNAATETFFNPDGSLQHEKVNHLARVYARSVAGVPVAMRFEREQSAFHLEYTLKQGPFNVATEIYLNQAVYYPKGLNVTLSPPNLATASIVKDSLVVIHDPAAAGRSLTVTITPKP